MVEHQLPQLPSTKLLDVSFLVRRIRFYLVQAVAQNHGGRTSLCPLQEGLEETYRRSPLHRLEKMEAVLQERSLEEGLQQR